MTTTTQTGTQLNAAIMLAAQAKFGNAIRLFRRNVAGVQASGGINSIGNRRPDRYFKCGEKGQADVYGWITLNGHAVSIEIETKVKDRPSKEQISWGKMCAECGVIYVLARGVDQALRELDYHVGRITAGRS